MADGPGWRRAVDGWWMFALAKDDSRMVEEGLKSGRWRPFKEREKQAENNLPICKSFRHPLIPGVF